MTPDPLDPDEQRAFRELDQTRRIVGCATNCVCRQDDAYTTPLDVREYE